MAIAGDYANPVYVNGYQCWNCTQVDEAKKDIDPANPKAGPFGIDANAAGQASTTSSGAPAGARTVAATPPGLGMSLDLTV